MTDKENPIKFMIIKTAHIISPAPPEPEKVEPPKEKPRTVRIVYVPEMGDNGLFVEPSIGNSNEKRAEREMQENLNRMEFVNHFHYEDPHTPHLGATTFDAEGNYECGDCNHQYDGVIKDGCTFIPIVVDLKAGSCKHYAEKGAGVREIDLSQIGHTAESSAYGVAKNGIGFGCHRCPYASEAKEADSFGRDKYCGKGDFRVFWNACCELNGAEVVGQYEGNSLKGSDDYDKDSD